MQASTIAELNRELQIRCAATGLQFDCGCGGILSAEIALVAEAPGERETALKQPLIGSSGRLLFDVLRKYGITRNHVYITNVAKRKLVTTSEHHAKPKAPITKNELEHWRAILRDELSLLPNLRYIVALGDYALSALTGENGITNWRGSVLDATLLGIQPTKVLVTYNPAYPQHEPKHEIVFRQDIGKLQRLRDGAFKRPVFTEHINPTYKQALEYISLCHSTGVKGTPISVDIETFGPATETVCVGLAHSNNEGMCIGFRDKDSQRYTLPEERELRLQLQSLLGDPRVKLIAQNGHFDASWMWYKDRIRWAPVWLDTMLAHHVLYPTLPHKLAFLTSQYTDHPYYKDDAKDWRDTGTIDQLWSYNVKDVCITRMVAFSLLQELREQGLEQFYFDYVAKLSPELVRMTVMGVKCDTALKAKLNEDLGREVEAKRAAFLSAARQATQDDALECNPLSTHDVADLLFRRLRLVGRGTSVDEDNRKRMLAHPKTCEEARKVITSLDDYKHAQKFHSTYVESEADPDGRMRCAYRQTGVQSAPGRLSSAATGWGTGQNLQNQPEAAKKMFVADEGYEFSYFDASQIEARIVAWKANITRWKEQFELARLNPGAYDAHCALASDMYKVPYDQVPRYDFNPDGSKTIRYVAKRCLPEYTEVLTQQGWQPIGDVCDTQIPIATWSNGDIAFSVPSVWYSAQTSEPLVCFRGEFASIDVTRDHRMPLWNNNKMYERSAQEFLHRSYGAMPITGVARDGIHEPFARIRAMAWADGHLEPAYPHSITLGVNKQWKVDRIIQLCEQAGLNYWYGGPYSNGTHMFRIYGVHFKKLSWDMLGWDLDSRLAFIDELKYWDGDPKTGRIFNTDIAGLSIIQAVAHISGMRATMFRHGTPRERETQCWMMRPIHKRFAYYSPMSIYETAYNGRIYCPTVDSDAFIVRQYGQVTVTLNCRHGLNYRMAALRLSTTAGLSLREAEEAYTIYHRTNPEIMEWWDATVAEVRDKRCLYNAFGRRLIVLERITDESLESIIAFYPQSTAGDHVARVIHMCHVDPEWPQDARIVLNVHDALIALNRPHDGDTVRKIMKKHAEQPLYINGEALIVPVELAKSYPDEDGIHRWSTIKKLK